MKKWLFALLCLCPLHALAQDPDQYLSQELQAQASKKETAFPKPQHPPLYEDEKATRYEGGLKLNSSYTGKVSPLRDERILSVPTETRYYFATAKTSNVELFSPKTSFLIDLDSLSHDYQFYSRAQSYALDRSLYRVSYRKDATLPFGTMRHGIGNAKYKVIGDIEQPQSFEQSIMEEDKFLISYSFDIFRFYLTLGYADSEQHYFNPYPMLSFTEIRESLTEENIFLELSYRLPKLHITFNYNDVRGTHERREKYHFKDRVFLFQLQYHQEFVQCDLRVGSHELHAALSLLLWRMQLSSSFEQRSPSQEELYGEHEYLEGNPNLTRSTRTKFSLKYNDQFSFAHTTLNTWSQVTLASDHHRISAYPKSVYYYSYENLAPQQLLQFILGLDLNVDFASTSYQVNINYMFQDILESQKAIYGLYKHDLRIVMHFSLFNFFELSAFYHYLSPTRVSPGIKTAPVHANALMFSIKDQKIRFFLMLRNLHNQTYYTQYLRPIKAFEAQLGIAYNKDITSFSEWSQDPRSTNAF